MIYSGQGLELTTNVHNVMTYGAVGDGTTDDTAAINKVTREIAEDGGIIYFPEGTYLVSSSIYFLSNQTLWFENGATLLSDGTYNNIMMNYAPSTIGEYNATRNVDIIGATFDGGTGTENITLLAFCHSQNIRIRNCTFKNAYGNWHDLEINSSKYITVDNCDFEGSRKTAATGELIQIEASDTSQGYPWGIKIDSTISKYIEIKDCYFHDSTSVAIGNHAWLDSTNISIHDNIFDSFTNNRAAIYFRQYDYVDVYNNTFNNCTNGVKIEVSGTNNQVHHNEFIGVTTVSSNCVEYDNYVNGALQDVRGNKLNKEVVQSLPSSNISENTIYFVPKPTEEITFTNGTGTYSDPITVSNYSNFLALSADEDAEPYVDGIIVYLYDENGNQIGNYQNIYDDVLETFVSIDVTEATTIKLMNISTDSGIPATTTLTYKLLNEVIRRREYENDKFSSDNKLDADYVDDTNNTNKFVTVSEKSDWDAKADTTDITTDTTSTTVSLTLADNHEYRYTQDLSSLTLTMPSGDFIASVVFASGTTPTQMTYDSSIKWSGDDVTSNAFVPVASKTYNIVFWYDGININAVVRGVA